MRLNDRKQKFIPKINRKGQKKMFITITCSMRFFLNHNKFNTEIQMDNIIYLHTSKPQQCGQIGLYEHRSKPSKCRQIGLKFYFYTINQLPVQGRKRCKASLKLKGKYFKVIQTYPQKTERYSSIQTSKWNCITSYGTQLRRFHQPKAQQQLQQCLFLSNHLITITCQKQP